MEELTNNVFAAKITMNTVRAKIKTSCTPHSSKGSSFVMPTIFPMTTSFPIPVTSYISHDSKSHCTSIYSTV